MQGRNIAKVLPFAFALVALLLQPALAAPRSQEGGVELAIVKTAETSTISPGQTIPFTISVINTGQVTATNVLVYDDYDETVLPTIQIFSEVEQTSGTGAQNDGDVIAWQIETLGPGEEWSATYTATAAETFDSSISTVRNEASVYVDGVRIAQADPLVLTVQVPQLTLTLERERAEGEGRVFPGDTVRYTIRYGNNGTANATNVVLEAVLNEAVVEQIGNIGASGQQSNGVVRWELGSVEAGASAEVTFEATLKAVLVLDTQVRCQASIIADGVQAVSTSDSFTPPPPLVVERQREDLNGGAIEPGDILRFTIRFQNVGMVDATDVVVRDDFAEGVISEVSDISGGGREDNGAIEWVLTDHLQPGAEMSVSYKVRLRSGITEYTDATNTAIIYIGGVEVDRAQTTMTIEPPEEADSPAAQPAIQLPVFQEETTVALLVGVSLVAALATVGGMAAILLRRNEWKEGYLRLFIEGVMVVVLAETVLVLAMNNTIESDGAVSILSSIVGYVFGRGVTQLSGSGSSGTSRSSGSQSSTPAESGAAAASSEDRPTHDLER